eukprot:1161446-Pelagomonas_calceolata.AAC.11
MKSDNAPFLLLLSCTCRQAAQNEDDEKVLHLSNPCMQPELEQLSRPSSQTTWLKGRLAKVPVIYKAHGLPSLFRLREAWQAKAKGRSSNKKGESLQTAGPGL